MSNRYLDILGLTPGVSKPEIKLAYRTLAKKYHPDINPGPGVSKKFAEIAEAYQFLMDLGPRPNHESVNYDYNPSASQYVERRRRAQAYAAKKQKELAAQQVRLNRILFKIFDESLFCWWLATVCSLLIIS